MLAGALGLALACDLIIAKEGARFGTPEINVGVFPFMIMALIYRNVGRKKTNELLLLGEQIDAHEAERIGIVNKVVPAAEFDAAVADWAGRLAAKSPLLMRLGKDAMHRQQDMALDRRARVPARAAHARVLDRRHPGGRQGVLREAGAGVDRPLSVTALRCRTSDRTPGGARGAEALALALDPDARLVGTLGEPRIAVWDDDLRDSHGCLLEAGGQVEDMLTRRRASRC